MCTKIYTVHHRIYTDVHGDNSNYINAQQMTLYQLGTKVIFRRQCNYNIADA